MALSEELQLFFDDAAEHLDACDRSALTLDEAVGAGEAPAQALNTLFRGVHTLKGNAGMMGMGAIVDVAHALEHLLDRMRAGEVAADRDVVDVIFAGLDALRALVQLALQGQDAAFEPRELVARLEAVSVTRGGKTAASRFPGWHRTEAADDHVLESGLATGVQFLYRLVFDLPDLDRAKPLGHPELEKLFALGKPLAWCLDPGGKLWVAYTTRADREMVERFKPDALVACDACPDGCLPEAPAAVAAEAEAAVPLATAELVLPAAEAGETSIRVGIGLLDKLMNLVGELVLTRNQVLQVMARGADAAMLAPVQRLNLITTELQEAVMRTRMQPIGQIWEKFPRLIRDYGRTSGKQIRLEMEGADTELDKSLLESIKDPLTHLVRNAMDHGVEPPEARRAACKPASGTIRLRARQDGGSILIEIEDDGRGLDFDRIRAKALAVGLASADVLARMGEAELSQLLFQPGFSTAEAVTDISGRGVGMDVVKSNIERIGGAVEIASTLGAGTTTRLKIPLTLAVIPALVIKMGCERFAIPQGGVLEVVRTGEGMQRIEQFQTANVYRLRDALIPVVDLRAALRLDAVEGAEEAHLVILQAGPQVFGLAVDEIGDTEEIVVKPLPRFLQAITAFSGVTIMGDGRPCMILDVGGLAACGDLEYAAAKAQEADQEDDRETGQQTQRMLIVGLGDRRYAIPMALVTRLEEFPADRLERIGPRTVVQYGDQVLPLIDPTEQFGVAPLGATESAPTVVFGTGDRLIGVRVGAIHDIVEEAVKLHAVRGVPGVLGAVVVGGRTTEVLDLHAVIAHAFPEYDCSALPVDLGGFDGASEVAV